MEIKKQELKPARPVTQPFFSYEQVNTITTFERLWTNIADWTRAYIVSSVFNLPNKRAVFNKLYLLPANFYNIVKLYYGTDNARTFVADLSEFVVDCMQMIDGMCSGEQLLVDTSTKKWYQAAVTLARFLSGINPYWDENQWENLLYQYARMKIEEIMAMLKGDFELANELFDRMEDVTFIMGSYMARGIIAMNQYKYI